MTMERFDPLFDLCDVPEQERNPQKLVSICTQLLQVGPNVADYYYVRALGYKEIGDRGRCLHDLDQAISLGCTASEAYSLRSLYHFEIGEFSAGFAHLNRAILLEPESAMLYWKRGIGFVLLKDDVTAIIDFTKSIELDPLAECYLYRGDAYYRLGKFKDASNDYTACIQLDPNCGRAYGARGFVHLHFRDYGAALSDLNRAAQLHPDWPDVFAARSTVHQALGNLRHARKDAERAERLGTPLPEPSQTLLVYSTPLDEYSDPEMEAMDTDMAELLWAMEEGEYFYDEDGEPHPASDYW